jgi:hypothetical protein
LASALKANVTAVRHLGLLVESAHVVEKLEGHVVAHLHGWRLGRDVGQEPLGVRNVHFLGDSARSELGQEGMETTHDSSPMAAEVDIALGQEPEDLGVVSHLDVAQARGPKGRHRDRVSVVGVVLVGTTGGEHSDARGKGGRDVEHLFTPCHELLGQQVAHPAGRLDGPPPLLERFGPAHELFDLTTSGTHLDAGDLIFSLVDGHRRVRCLMRVDPDHHLHDYLLGRCV